MRNNGFYKGESAGVKKIRAEKTMHRLKDQSLNIEPVIITSKALATSWWGKAWNLNLEQYADFSNRIARGKIYVRNNTVIDLKIAKGMVNALVQGTQRKPYSVTIKIDPLRQNKWEHVTELCHQRIETLDQLVEGKFPKELEILFTERQYGLFPSPSEIHFNCSCPDSAEMCKHVAATLYGVGARLDDNPMLFFEIRAIDGQHLIKKSIETKVESMLKNAGKKSDRSIDEKDITKIFGL